jgi:hypothetical protein
MTDESNKLHEIAIASLDEVIGGYVPTYARGRWTGTQPQSHSHPPYGEAAAQRAGFRNLQRFEYYKHIQGLPKGPPRF